MRPMRRLRLVERMHLIVGLDVVAEGIVRWFLQFWTFLPERTSYIDIVLNDESIISFVSIAIYSLRWHFLLLH